MIFSHLSFIRRTKHILIFNKQEFYNSTLIDSIWAYNGNRNKKLWTLKLSP